MGGGEEWREEGGERKEGWKEEGKEGGEGGGGTSKEVGRIGRVGKKYINVTEYLRTGERERGGEE